LLLAISVSLHEKFSRKLDALEVACDKCERKGRYVVARLIEQRGRDGKVVEVPRRDHRGLSQEAGWRSERPVRGPVP